MKRFWFFSLFLTLLLVGALFYGSNQVSKTLIAAPQNSEKLEISFKSYMTQSKGVQKLQFAELQQQEVIEETSQRKVLWNKLRLPEIVVRLEVPVHYSYYVDFEKEWEINTEDAFVEVVVPEVEFNPPAADISSLQVTVKKSSILRNEKKVAEDLKSRLTGFLNLRAQENFPLVKEEGRLKIEKLVEVWLSENNFDEPKPIKIIFKDELIDRPAVQ